MFIDSLPKMDFKLTILSVLLICSFAVAREEERCDPPVYEALIVKPFQRTYTVGSEVELSCEEGYELIIRNTSTCKRSVYIKPVVRFVPSIDVPCRKVRMCYPPFEEGLVVTPFKPTYQIGEEISLSCKKGYEFVGVEMKTCREKRVFFGGTYSVGFFPQKETCEKIKKCFVPLASGLIVTPFKPYYERGEEIALSCEEGYDLVTMTTATCGKSGYFDEIKQRPKFGDYYLSDSYHACKKKPSCEYVQYDGVAVSPMKTHYMNGEALFVSCTEGYYLAMANKTFCKAGYFDPDRPSSRFSYFEPTIDTETCKQKSKCMAPRQNGLILSPDKERYVEGEEVSLSCKNGYELTTVDSVVCVRSIFANVFSRFDSGGVFSPDVEFGACRKILTCDKPEQKGLIVSPSKRSYRIGEEISLTCIDGYKLVISEVVTCEASRLFGFVQDYVGDYVGSFKPKVHSGACEKIPTCDAPKAQEGLIITPRKDSYLADEGISLSCEEGYELDQGSKSVCKSRRAYAVYLTGYTGFKPEIKPKACKKIPTCQPPEQEGLILTPQKDEYTRGDTIELSCDDDYVLGVSKTTRTCKEGQFRPPINKMLCKSLTSCQGVLELSPKEMLKCLAKLFVGAEDDGE